MRRMPRVLVLREGRMGWAVGKGRVRLVVPISALAVVVVGVEGGVEKVRERHRRARAARRAAIASSCGRG